MGRRKAAHLPNVGHGRGSGARRVGLLACGLLGIREADAEAHAFLISAAGDGPFGRLGLAGGQHVLLPRGRCRASRVRHPGALATSASSSGSGGCRGGPHVARQSMMQSWQVLLPLSASMLMMAFEAARKFGDSTVVKELIADYTDITIVDSPVSRNPDVEQSIEAPHGEVVWHAKTDDVFRRLLVQGDRGLGESYMDGEWETNDHEGLIRELLKLEAVRQNLGVLGLPLLTSALVGAVKWYVFPENHPEGAKSNIAQHYDISTKLYERMLGTTMQYTCAYFHRPDMTLDEAQRAKMELVAKKLDLKPGMRLMEFGCGYGALAHFLATEYDVHVTGVTLSEDQVEFAHKHYAHPNVDIRLQDYRATEGTYDRVYSIGILEHIGRNNYETFWNKCYELLKDDGIMLVHSIGFSKNAPWNHNGFMNTYVFPGAELPHPFHLSQEFADKWHMEDWHSFGKSYAKTLRAWKRNLRGWEGLEEFDGPFRRMWEHYLMCSAASFEKRRTKLWQIVYTKLGSERPDDCHHIREGSMLA